MSASHAQFQQFTFVSFFFFFPFSAGGDGDSKSDNFEDIYKEMKVLDMSLFNGSDDLTQSRLRKVLELLGVKSLYPVHILTHHIIPRFKTVSPSSKMFSYVEGLGAVRWTVTSVV